MTDSKSAKVPDISLFNSEFINYENELIVKQYMKFVDSIENVTDRRLKTNAFFLSFNTIISGLMGVSWNVDIARTKIVIVLFSLIVIAACIYWIISINNFKKLNTAKFKILLEIEKKLPINLYNFEWQLLKEGKVFSVYFESTKLELAFPIILIVSYVINIILCIGLL